MVLPIPLPRLRPVTAHLDQNTPWLVEFGPSSMLPLSAFEGMADDTEVLLALPYSHRFKSTSQQQVVRFIANGASLSVDQIGAVDFGPAHMGGQVPFLIRDTSSCPYIFDGLLPSKPPADSVQRLFYEYDAAPSDVPYLALKKWSRRTDFLHRITGDIEDSQPSQKPYARVFPAPWAKVDTIPLTYAKFGMLIPSILHEVEVYLTAMTLSATLLKPINFQNVDLVLTAISSRSASEPTNYERLEFFGDSLLKYCATINVTAMRERISLPLGIMSEMLTDVAL